MWAWCGPGYGHGMDVGFSTSLLPRDDWHDGLLLAAGFQAGVWDDGRPSTRNTWTES